ncbi:MAG: glycosyltransferase family 2 protein [Pseudomonadota bacterium]
MSEPRVLVIIVTFNKKEYVSNLIDSLRTIEYRNYDIVLVDNASNDGTAEFLAANFPDLHVIRNSENTGGSGGFNTGFHFAFQQEGYDYLWLLDNDVEVSKNALSRLVAVLETNADIAVAGSQMCQLDNPGVTNEVGAYVDFRHGRLVLNRHMTRRSNNSTGIFDVDYVAAASLLVRADVAKNAGFWEDFFIHFDDVDWCLTIRKMGHRVVAVADSLIWHLSAAEKPITWAMYYDVRNMLFLLDKHATKKDVRRFGRRKVLHAIHNELKGFTPISELIFDAIDDFQQGVKGKKRFSFPQSISDETLRQTHPESDVLIFQSEGFDLRKFPFEEKYLCSVKEIMFPHYLHDAAFYWNRKGVVPVKCYSKLKKICLLLIAFLAGYRRYKRSYVDSRSMSFFSALLSEEIAVKIGDMNWVIQRDRMTVWKNTFRVAVRGAKQYWEFLF